MVSKYGLKDCRCPNTVECVRFGACRNFDCVQEPSPWRVIGEIENLMVKIFSRFWRDVEGSYVCSSLTAVSYKLNDDYK